MKTLKLTDERREQLIKEFTDMLDSKKVVAGGRITFDVGSEKAKEKQIIAYTPQAWVKLTCLLQSYSTEVAWHSLCQKVEDGIYLVEDLIVYPQIVTGATVDTDDDAYTQFLVDLPIEQAQKMRMQCHSHVNMGVTPSGRDLNNQQEIVEGSSRKGFYIFQIWNKSLKSHSTIYDFENGVMYEDHEIEVSVLMDDGSRVDEWADDTHDIVREKTPKAKNSYPNYQSYTNYCQGRMFDDGLE